MNKSIYREINLLGHDEQQLRISRLRDKLVAANISSAIISTNANIYYLTGRVFRGFILIGAFNDEPIYFVRRPNILQGNNVYYIRKPEEIISFEGIEDILKNNPIGLELDNLGYSEAMRLKKALGQELINVSAILRECRAIKTEAEIAKLRLSGIKHTDVYTHIPQLYSEGMTDMELQIEIERISRLKGCLGQFRIAGSDMEIFMGNVLTGENADSPSPYDFAMGGEGIDPSLPVGANGTTIHPEIPVMVDVNGNYNGYMTDMTRCFVVGTPNEMAIKANALSAEICRAVSEAMRPGAKASDLFNIGLEMAKTAGFGDYFMGHRYHAGFIGHGVGIEINESPVIAPKSRDIISVGNVVALEPKFVIPGIGAVGIENTYIVGPDKTEVITLAPEEIVSLI